MRSGVAHRDVQDRVDHIAAASGQGPVPADRRNDHPADAGLDPGDDHRTPFRTAGTPGLPAVDGVGLHNQRVNALLSGTVPVIGSTTTTTTTTARKSRNR